jgi:hypothetical protein
MKKFESIMVGTLVVLVAFGLIAVGISPAFTQIAVVDSGKLTNERMSQIKGGDNPRPHCKEASYDCPLISAGNCFKGAHEFEVTEGASACSSPFVKSMGDEGYLECSDGVKLDGNDKKCDQEQTRYCTKKTICVSTQLFGFRLIDGGGCQLQEGGTKYCGWCENDPAGPKYDPASAHTFEVCVPVINY